MPYEGERASRLGHVDVARNEAVKAALRRWTVSNGQPTSKDDIADLCAPIDSLPLVGDPADVDFSITVDGSDTEVETTRDHPTVKVGYLRVAGSMVRLDEFRRLAGEQWIDPRNVRRSHEEYSFDAALPGAQLVLPGKTGVETWRSELDDFMLSARFDLNSTMTLADGLLALYGTRNHVPERIPLRVCPTCRFEAGNESDLTVGKDGGTCPNKGCRLYLTDVLRSYEEYDAEGSNFSPLGRVMTAAERLMTICYVNFFANQAPEVLRHTLFVTDGPLALYGTIAPLKRRFQTHLADLTRWSTRAGMTAPLMVGIEKSGPFVEHANLIKEFIPEGSVMLLTRRYINRLIGREDENEYGKDEFYGRRFIYRTRAGDALVITVLPAADVLPYDRSAAAESLDSYPSLRLICEVLDSLRTRMYEHAVIPVALAHSAAALPLGVGRSVLTMMAQQNIPDLKVDWQAVQPPTYFKR